MSSTESVEPAESAEPAEPAPVVSPELLAPIHDGVELCYQTFGDPSAEPLVLVMGLGGPMSWWDPGFCSWLAREGFYVVRFDNRDTGRSTKVGGRVSRSALLRAFLGRKVRAPYALSDLARDTFALMDHLGLVSAHLAGVSMGGMVVQTMALMQPARVRSLTSIMSTTGRRTVGWQDPRLLPLLLARRSTDREAYVAASRRLWRVIGSPAYPLDDQTIRQQAGETWDRGVSASGVLRQMLAILTQPDRTRALHSLRVPSMVVHGLSDRMVHVSGGRATAAAVPGAELLLVDGMGHDLPHQLHGTVVEAVRHTADRA